MSTLFPVHISDAGRSLSKRPKQTNDCTVRALAVARTMPYDEAYDLLKSVGRSSGKGFHFADWVQDQSWATKISFPAVKGQPRMNPATFVKQFPTGTYICKVAKHVFTCVDGVIHDDVHIRANRCIYTAWLIKD